MMMDNKIDEMSLDLVREEEVAEEKKCKRRKHHQSNPDESRKDTDQRLLMIQLLSSSSKISVTQSIFPSLPWHGMSVGWLLLLHKLCWGRLYHPFLSIDVPCGPGGSDGPGGPGRPELCEHVREAPPKMLSSSIGQCLFGGGLGHLLGKVQMGICLFLGGLNPCQDGLGHLCSENWSSNGY